MPRDIQSIPITFANTGIVLKSAPDEIPMTSYMALVNMFTDRENSVSVRKGMIRLNDGLDATPYTSYFLRDINGLQWRYACTIDHTMWCAPVVAPNNSAVWPLVDGNNFLPIPGSFGTLSQAEDPRPLWANYTLIGTEYRPFVFMADGTVFLKHQPGNGITDADFGCRRVGIPRPAPLTNVSLTPNDLTPIENFSDYTKWTPTNCTLSNEAGQGPDQGMVVTLPALDDQTGSAFKPLTDSLGNPIIMDLGVQDLTELIQVYINLQTDEAAQNLQQLTIDFNLSKVAGDTSFTTYYTKALNPSALQSAVVGTSTYSDSQNAANIALQASNVASVYQNQIASNASLYASNVGAGPDALYIPIIDPNNPYVQSFIAPLEQVSSQLQTYITSLPVFLAAGAGVWNLAQMAKNTFVRVGVSGVTDPTLDWNTVTAIRVTVQNMDTGNVGGKTCLIGFNDCALQAGRLTGIDYQYVITYANTKTGAESDYSDLVAPDFPVANGQYQLTFPICPPTTPPLADPDVINIYRIGGTNQYFQTVDSIPYTPGLVPPMYIDDIADGSLGLVLETDNQLPPDGPVGCVVFDDRLWVWGGSYTTSTGVVPEPPNQIRFSKSVQVESFDVQTDYLYIGTGSEQIVNAIENDGELFVFTLTKVYRVVGSAGNYQVVGTAVNQGLKAAHGMVKGIRSLYMYSYDGIYEVPSGRKISEVINPLFFNTSVNGIPPIAIGREQEVTMAYYDSKVYFSYNSTPPGSGIPNDAVLVWDTIYERWHWYMYGAQNLFFEPDNNILIGSNISRWDYIQNGEFYGQYGTGNWNMQLETGFSDQMQDTIRGIYWVLDTKDYDLGMPDQEKRFIDFVFDADTQGAPLIAQLALDMTNPDNQNRQSAAYEPLGTVQTVGRDRVILPAPVVGQDSVLGIRCALRLQGTTPVTATSFTRLFKVVHRILPEPIRHRTHVTDWSDYGTPGSKFFRELWITLDNFNVPLDRIEVQIDQSVAAVLDQIPAVPAMTRLYFGLPPDTRGTLARLKIVPQGDNEVKVYEHNLQVMAEPNQINTIQSAWFDDGYPYPKLWKEVLLDIDTAGNSLPFNFWVDNKIVQTFNVQTNGRERVTVPVNQDTFGKLARITMSLPYLDVVCCLPEGALFYGVTYVTDKDPADVNFSDSYDYLWSFERLKILRRFWIAMKNPDSPVTMNVYMDDNLRFTYTIPAEPRKTGFSKRRIDLPSAIKGRLVRIIFNSTFAFQLYWDRSEWELKDLNTEDGYRRQQMVQPQTL